MYWIPQFPHTVGDTETKEWILATEKLSLSEKGQEAVGGIIV